LVQERMSRIDAKHRSRYTPEERFNILVHKETSDSGARAGWQDCRTHLESDVA
jgi:hypothetical protein